MKACDPESMLVRPSMTNKSHDSWELVSNLAPCECIKTNSCCSRLQGDAQWNLEQLMELIENVASSEGDGDDDSDDGMCNDYRSSQSPHALSRSAVRFYSQVLTFNACLNTYLGTMLAPITRELGVFWSFTIAWTVRQALLLSFTGLELHF